jgi:putative nucleotidyltransferase with HDIG domain
MSGVNARIPRWSAVKSPFPHADYRKVVTRRQGLIVCGQLVVFAAAVLLAILTETKSTWDPIELLGLLLVLSAGSDILIVQIRGISVSGALIANVLAMALLGPIPASVIAIFSTLVDSGMRRLSWDRFFNNVMSMATYPIIGAVFLSAFGAGVGEGASDALSFSAVVLGAFMTSNFVNFVMVMGFQRASFGAPSLGEARTAFVTVLPVQFATGLLTAGVAFSYGLIGVGAVGLLAVVLFVFQYLLRAGVAAFERGEELAKRTKELAALQVGLLSTVMQTLSMRDAMTARHSAAVARYAREVAAMLGLDEREQDLIHTAGLLHDIGKFIFPDSILFADRKLTDDEWETVRLHPEQGAKLVRRIEGYGPVADIILCHHERFDGNGYYKVPLEDIPLGSRIIACADTYDVMTSRDSYRRPVSSEAALVELRRVAGSQLDPLVVETFVEMVESRRVAFHHADERDFELELGFDRRVEDYARPRAAVAS